jgi:hypothetical protein
MTPERAIDHLGFIFEDEIQEQQKLEKLTEAEAAKLRADFQAVFLGRPEGKRVLSILLNESGVFESSFTGNSRTFYNEGKRDMGLLLLDYCFNIKDREEK